MCEKEQAITNNKRHVHADLIIAWANGAEIQAKQGDDWRDWVNPITSPTWCPHYEYRVKPKPPVKKYLWAFCLKRDGVAKATQFHFESEEDLIKRLFGNELGTPSFHWIQRIEASCKEFPA